MDTITYLLDNYGEILVISNIAAIFFLLLLVIIQGFKIMKMSKKYKKAFKDANIDNIEDLLIKYNNDISNIKSTNIEIIKDVNRIQIDLNTSFSKMALVNYDALKERAGRLSFVYVMLNRYNSGILINGIYNNEGHYLYLKEIENGKCEKELTREENQALVEAMKTKE